MLHEALNSHSIKEPLESQAEESKAEETHAELVQSITPVIGPDDFLPFTVPCVDADVLYSISECVQSGWIATGPRVQEFEAQLGLALPLFAAAVRRFRSCSRGLRG